MIYRGLVTKSKNVARRISLLWTTSALFFSSSHIFGLCHQPTVSSLINETFFEGQQKSKVFLLSRFSLISSQISFFNYNTYKDYHKMRFDSIQQKFTSKKTSDFR